MVLPFLAGYFISYVYRAVNAVLAPSLVGEFGISAGQLGFLTGVYFFSFGLFQVPLGVLLDRFGPRRVNARRDGPRDPRTTRRVSGRPRNQREPAGQGNRLESEGKRL